MELLLRPRPLCRFELDRERSNTWKKEKKTPQYWEQTQQIEKKGDNYYNPDHLSEEI